MKSRWTIKHVFGFVVLLAGMITATRPMAAVPAPPQLAPLLNQKSPKAIPGQYIVVFKPAAGRTASRSGVVRQDVLAAQQTVKKLGGTLGFTYKSALSGFSAKLSPAALRAVRALPNVAWIEADQTVRLEKIEKNPPSGLDRVDQRLLPLNNLYTFSETGSGVNVYVIDTGIRTTHTEFGGRASGVFTSITDGNGTMDCVGHGTHVAGTIGGATFGIAKEVNLFAVRVLDCMGSGTVSGVISGVDWVTSNAVHPAVANMSLGGGSSTALDTSVANSIASGVTYAIAAGNSGADACTGSPSDVGTAIVVGAIDPTNDTRPPFSNWGPCLKLFAPGVNILSAWNTSDTATNLDTGTSMASPHVAGVAARFLQTHPMATPADVLTAIHAADNILVVTPGWAGVVDPGAGSPNELLHWGSLSDGKIDGDPHVTTVDGTHYDFQAAGEFVSLRGDDGLEIQTRTTPVATNATAGDPYDGLTSCVSVNTAVAARVGAHRVTIEPNINGIPDPSGLQLRVDGTLTKLPPGGIDFGAGGGRIVQSSANEVSTEIDFPDGTEVVVTPAWWPTQSRWYLNMDVFHTPATAGIMGAIAADSWLPALPDGKSMGPMPASLHQRYIDLTKAFANAWRVTDGNTLFDYQPGDSTVTFTFAEWPLENAPCPFKGDVPVGPVEPQTAEAACHGLSGQRRADCIFDVTVTGEKGFADTYRKTPTH